MSIPIVTLKNGIRVGNFSSPHTFAFNTGEVLAACPPERANALMLETEEVEVPSKCGRWTDIQLSFKMSEMVLEALKDLDISDFDIMIVPLPVRKALDAYLAKRGWYNTRYIELVSDKCRVCLSADRVTKTIFSDRFCL